MTVPVTPAIVQDVRVERIGGLDTRVLVLTLPGGCSESGSHGELSTKPAGWTPTCDWRGRIYRWPDGSIRTEPAVAIGVDHGLGDDRTVTVLVELCGGGNVRVLAENDGGGDVG